MYTKKHIEAIKIVQELNREQMQLVDHFYQGDKDTYAEAFDSVMIERGIDVRFWGEGSEEDREKYREMYKKEIDEKFLDLVQWGKEEMEFLEQFEDHLMDLMDHVEINLSYNFFDFPDAKIEIDSTDFDPSNN